MKNIKNIQNIPTDVLRTFVSVVELRSYTRAAQAQGVTQPAVSAQIRRLQKLLNAELLDKSAPGVSLTATGELVLNSARRLLALNDQILNIAKPNPAAHTVRVGVPGDCMGAELTRMLSAAHPRWPHLRFVVQGGGYRRLLQGLKNNEFDLVLALVIDEPIIDARHYWTEALTWVRAPATRIDPNMPVPLVSYQEVCVCHRIGVSTLSKIGRTSDLVFRATNALALASAVAAGIGVMVVPRRRIPSELEAWDDGPLPPLPNVYCGIFTREEGDSELLAQLADRIAEAIRPPAVAPDNIRMSSR